MCGRPDRDLPPPSRPVRHPPHDQGRSQHSQPPPPPPLPPPSSRVPRSGKSRAQGGAQSTPLQQLSHTILSQASRQQGGQDGRRPDPADVLEAVEAVASCLNKTNTKYAIVGGAGLLALGSNRATDDVDFVVHPPGMLKNAKDTLRNDSRFSVNPRTRHTTFTSRNGRVVAIDALSFPGTFKGRFDGSTQLMTTRNHVNILNIPLYLESKCGSLIGRTNAAKRITDANDIIFILNTMIHLKIRSRPSEIPSGTRDVIDALEVSNPGTKQLFHQVGLV